MSQSIAMKIAHAKTRAATEAFLEEIKEINAEAATENVIRDFFLALKAEDEKTYRGFLSFTMLPFDRQAPKWAGGEADTVNPNPKALRFYLQSVADLLESPD